jgi:hypothetical protein
MWDPQHLTTLWACMACYRDRFTLQILLKYNCVLYSQMYSILQELRFARWWLWRLLSSGDVMQNSLLKSNRYFGGKFFLILNTCWFHACHILRSWRWRRNFPPKRLSTFNGLHGFISQNIELFMFSSGEWDSRCSQQWKFRLQHDGLWHHVTF